MITREQDRVTKGQEKEQVTTMHLHRTHKQGHNCLKNIDQESSFLLSSSFNIYPILFFTFSFADCLAFDYFQKMKGDQRKQTCNSGCKARILRWRRIEYILNDSIPLILNPLFSSPVQLIYNFSQLKSEWKLRNRHIFKNLSYCINR